MGGGGDGAVGENRDRGTVGRENRKTGGSAPTEFFGGITDLYFTPDLPSDVYVFNILDAHPARARARCTDASLPLNVQRSTNSYPLSYLPIPPLSCVPVVVVIVLLLLLLVVVVVIVVIAFTLSSPLISTQICDLLSAPLSSRFVFRFIFSCSAPLSLSHSISVSTCLSCYLSPPYARALLSHTFERVCPCLSRLFSFSCSPTS